MHSSSVIIATKLQEASVSRSGNAHDTDNHKKRNNISESEEDSKSIISIGMHNLKTKDHVIQTHGKHKSKKQKLPDKEQQSLTLVTSQNPKAQASVSPDINRSLTPSTVVSDKETISKLLELVRHLEVQNVELTHKFNHTNQALTAAMRQCSVVMDNYSHLFSYYEREVLLRTSGQSPVYMPQLFGQQSAPPLFYPQCMPSSVPNSSGHNNQTHMQQVVRRP